MIPEQVIRRPIILTEKVRSQTETNNQVVFEVARQANKAQVRTAIQALFGVTVLSVNTLIVRGRVRRLQNPDDRRTGRIMAKTQNWKKAIVTLRMGDKITFFQNAGEAGGTE